MLQFAVYDDQGPASDWDLTDACLIGPDDMPAPGEIGFKAGAIWCAKRVGSAVALCLMHDSGPMGRLMLQTCLLPDRAEPYRLTLELARHRIKHFIAKSEEWQLFDLSAEHPAIQLWEQARERFTDAMLEPDPRKSDLLASESLTAGIDASERLAMAHAEILLHRRYANRPASNGTLGIRIWPERDSEALRQLVDAEFDVLYLPLRWNEIEVEEGTFRWDAVDRWISWAHSKGKPVVAGPLLDFSKRAIPKWMYVWQHDYDTCRDLVYDYIEKVVHRYKAAVSMWNIARGLNLNDNFEFTPDQMIDLSRMTQLVVRQARPRSRVMIELSQPFGERSAMQADAMYGPRFLDRLVQEGVHLDAVGIQMLFGRSGCGQNTRDLMMASSLLDRFYLLDIPILISAMGVPSAPIDPTGGGWHGDWSPDRQGRWISRFFAIALSKPFVEAVFWADLYDHDGAELPHSGLVTSEGRTKPAFAKLVSMRRRLRKPLGALKLPARAK